MSIEWIESPFDIDYETHICFMEILIS